MGMLHGYMWDRCTVQNMNNFGIWEHCTIVSDHMGTLHSYRKTYGRAARIRTQTYGRAARICNFQGILWKKNAIAVDKRIRDLRIYGNVARQPMGTLHVNMWEHCTMKMEEQ